MSVMLCKLCRGITDTDSDRDSLNVRGHEGTCICKSCREEYQLSTDFDEEKKP
jgi:hypothetical protein